jgi:putative endopeptidase
VSPDNIDESVPCTHDFYKYANGTWLAKNPIPDIYPAWGSFLILRDENEERCKQIITSDSWEPKDQANREHTTTLFEYCKSFYDAAMDEASIDKLGCEPLLPFLQAVDAVDSKESLTATLAQLHSKVGVSSLFNYGSSIDKKNSDWTIASLGQGGLGLPDRDYYTDEDKADKREAYVKHIAKMLDMAGVTDGDASAIFEFEKSIAATHMTKTERRDPQKTYNIVTIAELDEYCPGVDWAEYLKAVHGGISDVEAVGKINLSTVDALKGLGEILKSASFDTLKMYMKWKIVTGFASHLSAPFVQENFEFFSKELSGTKEMKPRWKRAMGMLESNLGDALGQLYVDQHFSGDAKPMALGIVESVRDALKERLAEVPWMKENTREAAMEKMAGFRVQIGFTDEFPSFDFFAGKLGGDHVQNIVAGHQFEYDRDIARINKATDKNMWYMTPQTVNAYYHPSMNLICFPAAILQPPFFDPNADLAVNYGGMGAVVGHEMTHGFDDQGSQYDAKGNMENWWQEEDRKDYEARVDVMINQAEQHEVLGQKLKGKLTAGENLADLGGLRLSLRALTKRIGKDALMAEDKKIDGFTPLQRFFLSWATVWRQNITDDRAKQLVTIDPHGPNDFRANGPLRNMPEFYEAFGVKETDAMYKPEEERVDVW